MINKVIYYCWFGKNEKPQKVKNNITNWKSKNPGFKVIEINEDNFDYKKYAFTRKAYELKKWAFVSDMARMEILAKNGGFCLDTDVKLLSSLNDLRTHMGVWCLETSSLIAPGLIIGSEKENTDLRQICRIYENLVFDSEMAERCLKSPDIVTEYFLGRGLSFNNKVQIIGNDQLVLSSEYFAPYHWWGGGRITRRTKGIHEYENSWGANLNVSRKQKLLRNWRCNFPSSYFFFKNLFNKIKGGQ